MSRGGQKKMANKFSFMEEEPATTMNHLPTEILFKIMADVSINDLFAVRVVGPRVHSVAGATLRGMHMRTLMYFDESLPANIDNVKLQWLVSNMPLLQSINLGRVTPEVQPLDLDIVAEHCFSLRKIDFRRFRFTRRHVEKLCNNCPKLLTSQYGVRYKLYGHLGWPLDQYNAKEEAATQEALIRHKKEWEEGLRFRDSQRIRDSLNEQSSMCNIHDGKMTKKFAHDKQ